MVSIFTTLTQVRGLTTQLVSNKNIIFYVIQNYTVKYNYSFLWIIFLNLAIVINPKFTESKNNEIWNTINGHIYKLKQDVFKQAGVSIEVYTTTNIKLSRGKAKSNYLCVLLKIQLNSLELSSSKFIVSYI